MARAKPTVVNVLKRELSKRGRYLLAVSGGVDSVALLLGSLELAKAYKLQLEVAHVDHRLRQNSKADAKFVKALALKFKLPFHLSVAENPPKTNLEAWGRKVRYSFFGKVLKDRDLEWVLTAHTASDLAETLLMKLIANKEPSTILKRDLKRRCFRPLLTLTRNDTEAYVRLKKVSWCEDQSNTDPRFLRSRVRTLLMPVLKEHFDPRIEETLSERADALSEEFEVLGELTEVASKKLNDLEFGSKRWLSGVKELLPTLKPALRWRLAERLLRDKLGYKLGRRHSARVVTFLLDGSTELVLPGKKKLRRTEGGVRIL